MQRGQTSEHGTEQGKPDTKEDSLSVAARRKFENRSSYCRVAEADGWLSGAARKREMAVCGGGGEEL